MALPIKDLGILDICLHDNKIYEVKVRIGVDGIQDFKPQGLLSEFVNYLQGKTTPESIINYLELSPGMMGLAQIAMLSIPRGKVATYAQLAKLLGTSPRAVGKLVSGNKIPVLIPCHRIIKSDGSLGGYSLGIHIKERLLMFEGINVINGRISKQYLVSNDVLYENFKKLTRFVV